LFKGRLRLPSDAGEGIPIDLELEDVFLSLESGGEDFGEWRLDTVEIKRLFSNHFSMQLDGEEMVFIADDALGFAYDGLSAIEDVKSRLSKRRVFKGRKPKKKSVGGELDLEESEPDEVSVPDPTPDVPMPEVVPFFPESRPSFADSVAESAVADQSIAPVAPKPIEIADAEPEPAAPPPAPAPAVHTPPPVEPAPAVHTPPPAEPEQPAASVEAAAEIEAPGAATFAGADSFDDDDEELVIEDVSAYGYVPVASAPVEQRPAPVEPEPADDEIEIEDAAPATGAVLREVHPLGEQATAREVHPPGGSGEPEPPAAAEPEPVDHTPWTEPESDVAPAAAAAAQPVDEPAPVPRPPQGDSSFFAQWSSNGQVSSEPEIEPEPAASGAEDAQDGTSPQTQKSGRHARSSGKSRSAVFGRKKSREPEAHEHRYESSKTVGGITRRVCAICGHVSFAGEDVYQDW
jgi:hypothetical protein